MSLDLFPEEPALPVEPPKIARSATFRFPLKTWGRLDRLAAHYSRSKVKVIIALINSAYGTLTTAEREEVETEDSAA